jgi:hypothetical protein
MTGYENAQTGEGEADVWPNFGKRLIDTTLPSGLLDFFDSHAYNLDALADVTELNVLLVSAYARAAHNVQLSSAITETNQAMTTVAAWESRSDHWRLRTYLMAEQTFALLRQPGKVTSRQMFDYNTTLGTAVGGGGEYRLAGVCAISGGECSTVTPEMELMALFGRARGGVRVARNSSELSVWVEAVVKSDGKLVVLLLNRHDTVLPLNLHVGAAPHVSQRGWGLLDSAVVLDEVSLRPLTVSATSAGWGTELPAHGVAAVTFTGHDSAAAVAVAPPFTSELITTEALPDPHHFMLPVARGNTGIEVSLMGPTVGEPADDSKEVVAHSLTIGVRGWLENATLTATIPCSTGRTSSHQWVKPGTLVTTTLDPACTPQLGAAGVSLSLRWTAGGGSSCGALKRPTSPCPSSGPQGGWWESGGVCLQDCPLGMQGRGSSGRCICGQTSPNSSCFNQLSCIGGQCCPSQRSVGYLALAVLSTTHHAELTSAACLASLRSFCSTDRVKAHSPFASKPCGVCAGQLQRQLRQAGCTNTDITRYCAEAAAEV